MRIEEQKSIKFRAESASGEVTELRIRHSNRGEPFREGIELSLDTEYNNHATLFLNADEARQLRDFLDKTYPVINPALQQIAGLAREARPAHFGSALDRIEKIASEGCGKP